MCHTLNAEGISGVVVRLIHGQVSVYHLPRALTMLLSSCLYFYDTSLYLPLLLRLLLSKTSGCLLPKHKPLRNPRPQFTAR